MSFNGWFSHSFLFSEIPCEMFHQDIKLLLSHKFKYYKKVAIYDLKQDY
jgi:hypothetical protein